MLKRDFFFKSRQYTSQSGMFCAFVNAVLGRLAPPPLLNNMAMLKRLHTEPSIIFVMCEKDANYCYTSSNQ